LFVEATASTIGQKGALVGPSDQGGPSIFTETTFAGEWSRLVHLCTQLSGSSEAAEDLAQETLYEAWRHRDQLHEPQGQAHWHNAIARNVCLRWRALRFRDSAHLLQPSSHNLEEPSSLEQELADSADLEAEVERSELANLLERALHLLPAPTRHVLIARYFEELPYAAIAEQMGLREGTVKVQAHRAKLALRQVLTTQLREEAAAYGLVLPEAAQWQITRIWCPLCGQRHLEGRLDVARGDFLLQCPACVAEMGVYASYTSMSSWFRGVSGFKPALNRVMRWVNTYYQPTLGHHSSPGTFCGWSRSLFSLPAESQPEQQNSARGMLVCCAPCGQGGTMRLSNLVLYPPQAWQFWRDHPRLQLLEERLVEHQGRAALVTSFRSMTGPVQLDVVLAQETYEVLSLQPSTDAYHIREPLASG
jgi:RNA polymerase sigma factor (sigma-70 family)